MPRTLDGRQRRQRAVEYRHEAYEARVMREAWNAVRDAVGFTPHPHWSEMNRSDPMRAKQVGADMIEMGKAAAAAALTLPPAQQAAVKAALERVMATMTALLTADLATHQACPMALHRDESLTQALVDEAQLLHVAAPEDPVANERLLARTTAYLTKVTALAVMAAHNLSRYHNARRRTA